MQKERIEQLRRLVIDHEDYLNILMAMVHFQEHFLSKKELFTRANLLTDIVITESIIDCFFKALTGICSENTKEIDLIGDSGIDVALLRLPKSDLIHGCFSTEAFDIFVLYFETERVGLFNLNLRTKDSGIVWFSIPNPQDPSKSIIEVKIRFESNNNPLQENFLLDE